MGRAIVGFVGGVVVAALAALAVFYVLDLELVDRDSPPDVSTTTVTTTTAAQVTVPGVVGLSYPDAQDAIEAAGLSPIVKGASNTSWENAMEVTLQSPTAGTLVDEGSSVIISAR